MDDPESVMPDRVLPDDVRKQLSAALEAGAPLTAPLPSQARYARLRGGAMPAPRWRARALTVSVAIAGVVIVAFVGPSQPRAWIVQSVGHIAHDVGVPAAQQSPSPLSETGTQTHESPEPNESPEAHESSEPTGSPEPAESPRAQESPEPSQSPDGDHLPQPSPTAEPSDGGGGDGDRSPSQSPTPSNGD